MLCYGSKRVLSLGNRIIVRSTKHHHHHQPQQHSTRRLLSSSAVVGVTQTLTSSTNVCLQASTWREQHPTSSSFIQCRQYTQTLIQRDDWKPPNDTLVGVIGGIGPAASASLFRFVVELNPCTRDDQHAPLLIYNNPQIPNNNKAALKEGPPSLPAMIYTAKRMEQAGATHVVMPCDTAYAWAEELQEAIEPTLQLINILDLTTDYILSNYTATDDKPLRVGLMTVLGTYRTKLWNKLDVVDEGVMEFVAPTKESQEIIQECIWRIKAGEHEEVRPFLLKEAQALIDSDVDLIVLGCTELPLVLTPKLTENLGVSFLDPMQVLAHEIIRMSTDS